MSLQNINTYTYSPGFQLGQYHNAVLCISGNVQNLYLDGTLIATKTGTTNVLANYSTINQILIGCAGDKSSGFSGYLDDFRMYNYTLNQAQVSNLYVNRNIVAYYPFDNSLNGQTPNYATLTYDANIVGNAATISTSTNSYKIGNGALQLTNTGSAKSYVTSSSGFSTSATNGISISLWFKTTGVSSTRMRLFDLCTALGSQGILVDISGTNQILAGYNGYVAPVVVTYTSFDLVNQYVLNGNTFGSLTNSNNATNTATYTATTGLTGTYILSGSSRYNDDNNIMNCFRNAGITGAYSTNPATLAWTPSNPLTTTTISTTYNTNQTIIGDWIQIQLPSQIIANNYNFSGITDGGGIGAPNGWILLGSNNGTTWTSIDNQTTRDYVYPTTVNIINQVQNPITSNTTSYSYYRLVLTKCSRNHPFLSNFNVQGTIPSTVTGGVIDALSSSTKTAMLYSGTGASLSAGAFGTKLLYGSYTGPVMTIRRSSDSVTADFYANTTGTLGTAVGGTGTSLSSWLSTATAYVTKWWDQTGNSNHATQTNTGKQPTFNTTNKNIVFTARNQTDFDYFDLPNGSCPYGNTNYTYIVKFSTTNLYGFVIGCGPNPAVGGSSPSGDGYGLGRNNTSGYQDNWWSSASAFINPTGYADNNVVGNMYNGSTKYITANGNLLGSQAASGRNQSSNYNAIGTFGGWYQAIGHNSNGTGAGTGTVEFLYILPLYLANGNADKVLMESTTTYAPIVPVSL